MTLAQPSTQCARCAAALDRYAVCSRCGAYGPLDAMRRIELLVDRGSLRETEKHLRAGDPIGFADRRASYEQVISEARAATGLLDAVVTGHAQILGRPVALGVFDFGFMGGSMGSVVGEKVVRVFEAARRDRVPAIIVCSSGGARIQEGMVALFQMAKTALFAARLREAGVPLITVFCDPTMGGVLASFASMGDVIVAEPGARVSFVGPRVHDKAIGDAPPPGTAEFAFQHGMVDCIVQRHDLRLVLGHLSGILAPADQVARRPAHGRAEPAVNRRHRPVWETVELARRPDRPSGRELVQRVLTDAVELHGDRVGEDDDSICAVIGMLGGRVVAVVAQDRKSLHGGRTRPSGYRKAQRAFTLAERFHLPLVTIVDTPGAATDAEAEAAGITSAVAESLARLGRLRTQVVNVVVGEGGSGGALALSTGDRLLMMENAIFSVIGPEAASSILYRDRDHARELAESLKLTAPDLLSLHIVDRIVPEQPPGHEAPDVMAAVLSQWVGEELAQLDGVSIKTLLERRRIKYRHAHSVHGRFNLFGRSRPHDAHGSPARTA